MTPARRRARVLLLAIALLVPTACHSDPRPVSPSSSASPSSATRPVGDASVLLSVETRGGNCPKGPCGSLINIGPDGAVHQVRPSAGDLGTIPKAEMDALRIEIDRTNFPLIESRPFTGTCPTAYDGQETIYVFTVGQATGFERIASCEVAIDPNHPLFAAVATLMRSVTLEGS